MADTFKGFVTSDGKRLRMSHNDLEDLPSKGMSYNNLTDLPEADTTLAKSGAFADAKTVGDKITELEQAINNPGQAGTGLPDNIVLFEEVEDEEVPLNIEILVDKKIRENLTLDADGEYIRLLYGEDELGKVPMGNSGVEIVPCTGITINESDMNIDISSDKIYKFTATTTPADCTQTLRWISSVPSVATISSTGKLTVVGQGSTVITARCGSYTDAITIKIVDATIKVNVLSGSSWFLTSGKAQLGGNAARAYTSYGKTTPPGFVTDADYAYAIPLQKDIAYKIKLDASVISEGYYGVQVFDADAGTRIEDAGWKAAGTEYVYTPVKDKLYMYINFKYGSAGSVAITEEIRSKLQAGLSISMEV